MTDRIIAATVQHILNHHLTPSLMKEVTKPGRNPYRRVFGDLIPKDEDTTEVNDIILVTKEGGLRIDAPLAQHRINVRCYAKSVGRCWGMEKAVRFILSGQIRNGQVKTAPVLDGEPFPIIDTATGWHSVVSRYIMPAIDVN